MPYDKDIICVRTFKAKDWPRGLRCIACGYTFKEGDVYAQVVIRKDDLGVVCLKCKQRAMDDPFWVIAEKKR